MTWIDGPPTAEGWHWLHRGEPNPPAVFYCYIGHPRSDGELWAEAAPSFPADAEHVVKHCPVPEPTGWKPSAEAMADWYAEAVARKGPVLRWLLGKGK